MPRRYCSDACAKWSGWDGSDELTVEVDTCDPSASAVSTPTDALRHLCSASGDTSS